MAHSVWHSFWLMWSFLVTILPSLEPVAREGTLKTDVSHLPGRFDFIHPLNLLGGKRSLKRYLYHFFFIQCNWRHHFSGACSMTHLCCCSWGLITPGGWAVGFCNDRGSICLSWFKVALSSVPQNSHEPEDTAWTRDLLDFLNNAILNEKVPPRITILFLHSSSHTEALQEGFSLISL